MKEQQTTTIRMNKDLLQKLRDEAQRLDISLNSYIKLKIETGMKPSTSSIPVIPITRNNEV